ncbi:hypothetical protein FisN_30Lh087 [Fistulifera solaris]|uniref:BspA family leucine-rich repeat surface protein n=1 Tax=Fistulifera solaris TaxID=1519565 RepID=A0A1Z5JIG1_FISSO|nr:hypothetical protein FisN_30Lh087 [Fistulifera solaris]|eukprot:GAX13793.1 hypothetical protein FisN_30Lh087 [Fistulifera solaris]
MRQGYSDSSSDEDDDNSSSSEEERRASSSRGHYSNGSSGDEDSSSDEEPDELPIEKKGNYSDGSSNSDDGSYDDEDQPSSPVAVRRGKYSESSSEDEDSLSYEDEDQRGLLEEKEDDSSDSSDNSNGDDSGENQRRSPVAVENPGDSSDYDESSNGEVNQDEGSSGGEDQGGNILPRAVESKTRYSEDGSSDYDESSDGEAEHDQAHEFRPTQSKNEGNSSDRSSSYDESSNDDQFEDQPTLAVEATGLFSDNSNNYDGTLENGDEDQSEPMSIVEKTQIISGDNSGYNSSNEQVSKIDEKDEDSTGGEDQAELDQETNGRSVDNLTSRSDDNEPLIRNEEKGGRASGIDDNEVSAGNKDYSVFEEAANEEYSNDTTDDEESSAIHGKYEAANVDVKENYSENFSDDENSSIDEKWRTAEDYSDCPNDEYSDGDRDNSDPSLGMNPYVDGSRSDDDNREPSEGKLAANSIEIDGHGTVDDEDPTDRSVSDSPEKYIFTEFSGQFNDNPTSNVHDVEWNPSSHEYRSDSPSYESANASANVCGLSFQESNIDEHVSRVVTDDADAVDASGSKICSNDDDVEAQDFQGRDDHVARKTPRYFDFLNPFKLWSKTNSSYDENVTERKEGPKGDSFWPGKSHYGYIGIVLILLVVILILIVRGRDSSTTPSSFDNVGNSTTTPTVINVTSNPPTRGPIETIPPTLLPENLYISGEAKIQSSREPIEGTGSDLSEKLCVKYLAGSEEYEEGCFSTIYNRNGLAIWCTIEYDGSSCGTCSICFGTIQESNLPYVGFETDCGNLTNCTELTEPNIQDFLVGPAFSDQDIWPTITSAPVVAPTDNSTLNKTIAPTLAPTSTDDCFSSRDDLILAVDEFIAGNSVSGGSYIGDWCISSVKDLSFLFAISRSPSAASFNGDLSGWDVSRATDLTSMFEGASGFNSDLSSWDVSSVTSTANMFNQATSFTGDISSWNVSSVTDMSGMFSRASSFDADISTWDVSNVRKMDQMFFSASAYNNDLSSWDLDSVESFNEMFRGARFFSQDLCSWADQLEGRIVNASTVFSLTQCPTTSEIDFSSSPPSPFCFRCGF